MIFLEDPHLNSEWNLNVLEEHISTGKAAVIISEHVITKGSNEAIFFGAQLHKEKNNPGTGTLTVIQEDPDFPDLTLGRVLDLKDTPAMDINNFDGFDCLFIPGTQQCLAIAEYAGNNRWGIVSWQYGLGKVTFFSDFVEQTEEIDFPTIVMNHIVERVSYLIDPDTTVSCKAIGNIASGGKFSGDILIENVNNEVVMKNV